MRETPDRPKWAKTLEPWATVYRAWGDAAVLAENSASTQPKWQEEVLPTDIGVFDFTPMEDGMRRIASLTDNWKADYLTEPCVDLELSAICVSCTRPVGDWWTSEVPSRSPELSPFIKEYMKQHESFPKSEMGVRYQEALDRLQSEGTERMKHQATAAQIMWSARHPRSAGKRWAQTFGWGERYPRIDYTAQELSIGNLYFLRIDVGFEIPIGQHLRTASGEQDKLEKNQRVCVHIAPGMEWLAQGRPRRIPNKSRVMAVAGQIRSAEYQQAQEFVTFCTLPRTNVSGKLFPPAHDVRTTNHDRSFQDIHVFLSGSDLALHNHFVRVFDLEWRGDHTAIRAHQFGDPNLQVGWDMRINLVAWRGHMRFLYPSTDTRATNWRDWQQQIGHVTVHAWTPWDTL